MTVHVLGRVVAESGSAAEDREGVRETLGTVVGEPLLHSGMNAARALLHATRITCRKTGATGSASRCIDCERFVNYRPSRDHQYVTIRCRWDGSDPVALLMRPIGAVVTAPPDCSVGEAVSLASDYNLRHLLVVDNELVCGIVDLKYIDQSNGERSITGVMSRRMWITFADATLADVARLFEESGVEVLPVVEDNRLVGLITRDDLKDVGLL